MHVSVGKRILLFICGFALERRLPRTSPRRVCHDDDDDCAQDAMLLVYM